MRQWNVVAGLAIALSLMYAGVSIWALATGKAEFTAVEKSLGTLTGLVLGYLGRMLTEEKP